MFRPQVGKLPAPSLLSAGTTIMRPAGPGGVARPALPTRPLQVSAASSSLMPPPKVKEYRSQISLNFQQNIFPSQAPGLVIKKSGGALSAAGDEDINDVVAMGGVNLGDEAKVGALAKPSQGIS